MDQILIKTMVSSSETGDCGLKPYLPSLAFAFRPYQLVNSGIRECPSCSRIKEAAGPCIDLIDLNYNDLRSHLRFPLLYDTQYSSFENLFLSKDTMIQQNKSSVGLANS